MTNLTPNQCFDLACSEYNKAKSIVSDLSAIAKQAKENFSYEIAMRQFDMILQSILLNIAVDDEEFHDLEKAFIKNITDYGDVLNRVNRECKKQNSEWIDISWDDINNLKPENKKKFAVICATEVSALGDEFAKFFAPIDVINDRDFLEELQSCIFKMCILLSAIDEGGFDASAGATPEQLRGIAIYEALFHDNWTKHMDQFMNS